MAESTLPQGRELDVQWAERVLKLDVREVASQSPAGHGNITEEMVLVVESGPTYDDLPLYSSTAYGAWLVKAEMIKREYSCVVEHERGKVTTTFFGPGKTYGSSYTVDGITESDEARCIVSAALDALRNAGEVPDHD